MMLQLLHTGVSETVTSKDVTTSGSVSTTLCLFSTKRFSPLRYINICYYDNLITA
jgi:hypothetical protein